MKKRIDCVFAVGIGVILVICLAKSVFFPKTINEYENRYMEQFGQLNAASYFDGSFQDKAESALGDQLPLAVTFKRAYNKAISGFTNSVLKRLIDTNANIETEEERLAREKAEAAQKQNDAERLLQADLERGIYRGTRNAAVSETGSLFITFPNKIRLYKDHLLYGFTPLDWVKNDLNLWIADVNKLITDYPDIDVYTYYVEKENDLDFENGNHSGIFEYIHQGLKLIPENKRGFFIDSFNQFDNWFFKTDHHWNAYGSYRGYTQLVDMLVPEEIPLPSGRYIELGNMSGSKTTGQETQDYSETIGIFDIKFSDIKVTQNGSTTKSYGSRVSLADKIKSGETIETTLNYGNVFGPDSGEIIFENPNSSNGNILIIGESFDNAVLLPLAEHFSQIFSIDLRNYKAQTGNDFNLDKYIEENNISRILFMGNIDYFISDIFRLSNYR